MYRLLLILILVGLGEAWYRDTGYRYSYGHRRWHYNKYDKKFQSLANHVISADRYLRGFCKDNANCNVRELYEDQGYKLVYFIPQCSVDYISVKIKHRVIYMSAQQILRRHPKTYVDMRILPDMLSLTRASWTYDSGKLEIYIPYKVSVISEFEASCGDINTRVIRVKQASLGFRFGEDEVEYDDMTEMYDTTTDSYDATDAETNSTFTPAPASDDAGERLIFSSL